MRGGHHSLSGLLSGQDQNWFKIEDKYFGNIEKLQPAQVHSKFQASSGSRVVFQMFWTLQVSTVVIQMKCGHPCDSDDRDPCFGAACLFELPWVSEGIPPCLNGPTDHWPQPTPFYPWTQITKHFSQKFWRDVADKRRRRWTPVKSPFPYFDVTFRELGIAPPQDSCMTQTSPVFTTHDPQTWIIPWLRLGFWWR